MEIDGIGAMAQDLEPLVGLFRLLSDKTRLNILIILARGERNVSSMCEELGLPQPTVSHHLGLLRTKKLISNRRNGKQVFYGLNGSIETAGSDGLRINCEPYSIRISERVLSGDADA
jgi:DNA-binding transcriptional ArsR family regulator